MTRSSRSAGATVHHVDVLPQLRILVSDGIVDEGEEARHAGEGCAQLVRDRSEELLAHLDRIGELGDVVRDDDGPLDGPVRPAELVRRGEHGHLRLGRPEPREVPADHLAPQGAWDELLLGRDPR
ncbi:hypothetical protein QE388_000824 [Microbacterium sp. SORGH_AS 969]|nr:hypothetical protein [Microbacterium sp. SORGH_AS_0969]